MQLETPFTVVFSLLLIAAIWLTASMASGEKGMKGVWIGAGLVLLALVVCASVSFKAAAVSVAVALAVFRFARWCRDQDMLGPRATWFYRELL